VSSPGRDAGHTANVFGALSLLVSDRMEDAVGPAAGGPDTTAAALSALLHLLDDPPIDRLGRALGLTSSGTVRLVDRLERAGHVRRRRGDDARSSLVVLTATGRRAAQRVSAARLSALEDVLGALDPRERRTLGRLVAKMVAGAVDPQPGASRWICRMCDTGACDRAGGRCPAHVAAVAELEKRGLREPGA
jgi:DNA-binding MarR family transcriptional regulator